MLEENTAATAADTTPHQRCSDMSEVACIDQLKIFYVEQPEN
jgi:hypothetical protein